VTGVQTCALPIYLEAFIQAPGDALLLCAGDPVQHPECLDVAVVLPELLRVWPGRFRAGVVTPDLEASIQARYGFQRWPTLIFLRRGGYLGAVSGIQDWVVYLARIETLLAAETSRPPSIGIPVASHADHGASHTCH
jgi:hydrogenase-1 operon protein HyaE